MLAMGGCAAAGTEEREQWDAAIYALGNALMQFGNQQMQAEQWRQWEAQQTTPRPVICSGHAGYMSCSAY
jgi:hypothetical protein